MYQFFYGQSNFKSGAVTVFGYLGGGEVTACHIGLMETNNNSDTCDQQTKLMASVKIQMEKMFAEKMKTEVYRIEKALKTGFTKMLTTQCENTKMLTTQCEKMIAEEMKTETQQTKLMDTRIEMQIMKTMAEKVETETRPSNAKQNASNLQRVVSVVESTLRKEFYSRVHHTDLADISTHMCRVLQQELRAGFEKYYKASTVSLFRCLRVLLHYFLFVLLHRMKLKARANALGQQHRICQL